MHWIALRPSPDAAAAPTEPALVDTATALAWWALRFTPLVARVGDVLVLEVSASERLWGGRGPGAGCTQPCRSTPGCASPA